MEMSDYKDFVDAVAAAGGQPEAAYAALEALAKQLLGVKLFTIMTADPTVKLSERIYSNMPDVYPVSGIKSYNETAWSEITLNRKEIFVANTIEAIAEVFDDHEMIHSLGCQSVINVPITVDGTVIGLVNCLHDRGHYTEDRILAAEALKLPGTVCMLLHARQKRTKDG